MSSAGDDLYNALYGATAERRADGKAGVAQRKAARQQAQARAAEKDRADLYFPPTPEQDRPSLMKEGDRLYDHLHIDNPGRFG